jgi:hypothetical protein
MVLAVSASVLLGGKSHPNNVLGLLSQLLRRLEAATADTTASFSSFSPCSALCCRARVNSDSSRRTAVLPPAAAVRHFLTLQASHGCCNTTQQAGHTAALLCRSSHRNTQ